MSKRLRWAFVMSEGQQVPAKVFGAVADDDTGATDLAGMLADEGLRTVLVVDIATEKRFLEWTAGYDAVVIGASTRALAPPEAYDRTRAAVRLLTRVNPRVFEVKYCSTFDSTAEGNIGPSIDAAMDELGEPFTVALPALPVNGRTTYMGHHFVFGRLLSDSPMRNHPLTPMTNANLVSHLATQTRRKVGLAAYPVSRDALERLRADGAGIAILDCIDDADLERVCEAISRMRLITGSSAPAMKLPRIWRRRRWYARRNPETAQCSPGRRGLLVVAGSCSTATRAQNEWLEAQGAEVLVLDPVALMDGDIDEPIPRGAGLRLVRTASEPDDRERVRRWAEAHGTDANQAGLAIARGLAQFVRRVFDETLPAALVVAGGETSGAVTRALELGALEVGRNIEPGVPLCVSLSRHWVPVVLKSGNFGSRDFYGRALDACMRRIGGSCA